MEVKIDYLNLFEMMDTCRMAVRKYGRNMQTIVAIEEMSELTKELTKNMRGKNNTAAIVEELADVTIMLQQIMIMYDIQNSEVFDKMKEKIDRLNKTLKVDFVI